MTTPVSVNADSTNARPAAATRGKGRPRTSADAHAKRHELLLDAAEALIVERGVHAVSVDDIARRAGLSRATAYRSLGSKDDVVLAVTFRSIDEWLDGLRRRTSAATSAAGVVRAIFAGTLRVLAAEGHLAGLVDSGSLSHAGNVVGASPTTNVLLDGYRDLVGAALRAHEDELRSGLDMTEVVDHLLMLLADRLSAARRGWPVDDLDRWLGTWVLPAIIESHQPNR